MRRHGVFVRLRRTVVTRALTHDQEDSMTTFPHENEEPVGESEETAKQKKLYEAGEDGTDEERDHALGGTEGTSDGQ
jgi:hypothetical protein